LNGARLVSTVNGDLGPMYGREAARMLSAKHIVVFDDNIASLIGALLEDTEYQFTAYTEIEGAVERIRAAQPDLVILDLYFHGRPLGLDAFHALRANATTAELPIIITTAAINEGQALERQLKERPTPDLKTRFMPKPFDQIEDILIVIDEMLES
jgi:two-component system, OmpR family, alkaline phosphatase synthesis response regulator PhoP